MSEWISVKDRMPSETGNVLVIANGNHGLCQTVVNYYICPEYLNGLWETLDCEDFHYTVTNWMPLPEPPLNK